MTASRILMVLATLGLILSNPWPEAFGAPAQAPDPTAEESVVLEPVAPLGLEHALELALAGSPKLAVFSWETRASEARAVQARKSPNPELELRLQSLERAAEPDESRRRVMLSQRVELGGKLNGRVGLAQAERQLAGWDYEASRIEVESDVTAEFVAVLGGQRQVGSWRQFVEFLEETRDRVAPFVESGFVGTVESHRIARQIGLARIELERAESELAAARFRLAATWGNPSPRFTEAVGDLEPVGPVPDIATVLQLAQQGPAGARWDAELARGRASLALAKAERVPDLTVGVGTRWETDVNARDYLVEFQIPLPILDRNQGSILEARYELAGAQAARRAAAAASSEEIATSYYALTESVARSATLRDEIVPAARAMFQAHSMAFESEVRQAADLIDARRDLARAEVEHIEALVDSHQALAMLERLVGQSLQQRAE